MCINLINVVRSSLIVPWFRTISPVLSWGLTPFSGSFKLESGPTDLVVKLGMAAANILVSHIQMATFRESASLDFLQVCVFSKVLETIEATFTEVRGPMGGDWVKWPSRQTSAAEKHRSSMVSLEDSSSCTSGGTWGNGSDSCGRSTLASASMLIDALALGLAGWYSVKSPMVSTPVKSMALGCLQMLVKLGRSMLKIGPHKRKNM
uniref:Uncharacterized protein n=1 Tax=Bionectria ochroleuca TaxID=29856 RepID=A0A8H7NFQ0_BIOOC